MPNKLHKITYLSRNSRSPLLSRWNRRNFACYQRISEVFQQMAWKIRKKITEKFSALPLIILWRNKIAWKIGKNFRKFCILPFTIVIRQGYNFYVTMLNQKRKKKLAKNAPCGAQKSAFSLHRLKVSVFKRHTNTQTNFLTIFLWLHMAIHYITAFY